MDYDPLLSKLIAWGNSREETIARLRRALEEYTVTGIKSNAGLFRRILTEPDFLRGEIHTKWLDELLQRSPSPASASKNGPNADRASDAAAIAAALWQANHSDKSSVRSSSTEQSSRPSRWKQEGRRQQLDRLP
jgi:acetyl-CoA carboxylase biotin carboxylase subunit